MNIRRRILAAALAAAASCTFFASGTLQAATVASLDGKGRHVSVEVPDNPQRIAVLDLAVLDMMTHWDLTDRIVAMPKAVVVPFLKDAFEKEGIRDVGNLKEIDMEGLMSSEPDVIFINGRLSKKFDQLSKIAPVIYLSTDRSIGTLESFKRNIIEVAKIFGKEKEAEEVTAGFNARAERIAKAAAGKTAVVGMVTSAHVNLMGDTARCSLIGNEFGFKNLAQKANANHGNEASFELLLKLNPDYFFVLDRDSAIGRQGAKLAQDILDNDMVARLDAKKNGNIVYLTPSAWYLVEGGIGAMEVMFSDVEKALDIAAE